MLKLFFDNHFEWTVLALGLLVMALMNPYIDNGTSWCLLEQAGITFCPGEGLGHSIAFTVRGEFSSAIQAHVMGPFAILIIFGRILFLLKKALNKQDQPI